jgi:tetratricopeptide (TPR) repeat protein
MLNKININSQKQIFLVCVVLIIATLAVFWQVKQFDFINLDDPVYVTQNSNIQSGISPDGFRWAFNTRYFHLWTPLTWLSFIFDYQIHGLNAGGYHLTNLILHILSTLLLFWLFNRMTKKIWESAFVAAVFALHPLHVESVAWIAERKDVLSAFFWMLTLCLYVYYTEKPIIRRYLLVLFSFACALMSKPMVVTLPVVMILLDYWPLGRFEMKKGNLVLWQLREKMPLFILSAVFSIITLFAQHNQTAKAFPFCSRIANASVSFITYLGKTFIPVNMAVFYPFPDKISFWQVSVTALLIIIISAAVIIMMKRLPYLFVGWFWYVIILLPVIGIIQIGSHAMADRYHYLPSIGIAVMVAWGAPLLFQRKDRRKEILLPLGIVSLAVMAFLTWQQCGYWKDSISIFNHSLQVTKDNYLARNNRGTAYSKLGQYDLAIEDYNAAISLNPDAEVYNNRGVAYANIRQYQLAIDDYNEAFKLKHDYTDAYNNRGIVYYKLGRHQLAVEDFSQAIGLKPDNAMYYKDRGNAYFELNQYEKAIKDYNDAIRLKPDYLTAYNNRGNAYSELGQQQLAIEDYRTAIRLKPDDFFPYYNMACCLAVQKNDKEACDFLTQAIEKGFNNWNQLKKDKDFNNIRNSACFINLLKQMEK